MLIDYFRKVRNSGDGANIPKSKMYDEDNNRRNHAILLFCYGFVMIILLQTTKR